MAHLFRQLYYNEVDFEETTSWLTLCLLSLLADKIQLLEELDSCEKETDLWMNTIDGWHMQTK